MDISRQHGHHGLVSDTGNRINGSINDGTILTHPCRQACTGREPGGPGGSRTRCIPGWRLLDSSDLPWRFTQILFQKPARRTHGDVEPCTRQFQGVSHACACTRNVRAP